MDVVVKHDDINSNILQHETFFIGIFFWMGGLNSSIAMGWEEDWGPIYHPVVSLKIMYFQAYMVPVSWLWMYPFLVVYFCLFRRKRSPRTSGGYVQMGTFERPVKGTFAVKNEDLDEQDIDEDDDNEDANEDEAKESEEAAFITDKPSPEPPDGSEL